MALAKLHKLEVRVVEASVFETEIVVDDFMYEIVTGGVFVSDDHIDSVDVL